MGRLPPKYFGKRWASTIIDFAVSSKKAVTSLFWQVGSATFFSDGPAVDSGGPQRCPGHTCTGNSLITFSDLTGLLHGCGSTGVARSRSMAAPRSSSPYLGVEEAAKDTRSASCVFTAGTAPKALKEGVLPYKDS